MPTYGGRITTTGSSQAVRLDKEFFAQNPEFQQKARVQAHVIGRGVVLLTLSDPPPDHIKEDGDPAMQAFLAFLDKDMEKHPNRVKPLDEAMIMEDLRLLEGLQVSDDETFDGDEADGR